MLQKNQTVRALPLRIRIRKMRPDISQPGGPEQRIAKRMCQHISIRMPHRPFVKRQLNPANNQLPPPLHPNHFLPNPHPPLFSSPPCFSIYPPPTPNPAVLLFFFLGPPPTPPPTPNPPPPPNPASSEALTPSACARANASFN